VLGGNMFVCACRNHRYISTDVRCLQRRGEGGKGRSLFFPSSLSVLLCRLH